MELPAVGRYLRPRRRSPSCGYLFTFQPARAGRFTDYLPGATNGGLFAVKVQGREVRPVFLPLVAK